ncbi:hypothetical protein V6N11_043928 [Hibiscus sabdariffa]|uniref:Uncharacterized protein n=1 Tax=Hibiscus sabdariffa TaxID=183260 RepID=A0ABR2RDQ7_9ROSI
MEIVIILWALWFARNRKVHEGKSQTQEAPGFVPCSDNLVAHILAKDASLGSAGSFWVEEVPVVVRQRLLRIGVLSNPS